MVPKISRRPSASQGLHQQTCVRARQAKAVRATNTRVVRGASALPGTPRSSRRAVVANECAVHGGGDARDHGSLRREQPSAFLASSIPLVSSSVRVNR
ncbi:hypothetical protein MRX96_012489 [Rhipicephalus microplus]